MEQLTGQDASFLYAETPTSPMHIGGMMIYDPSTVNGEKQRFKDILAFVEERLHLAKTFRQKLVEVPFNLDHPYWIDDKDFDLEFHVRHIRLPEPGDWRQLCIQAARLHARPLDLTKPLWEFTVIEGLDSVPGLPEGSYAIISKIHHACIDGVSGADITEVIHSLDPYPEAPPPPSAPYKGESVPNPLELVTRAQLANLTQPMRFAEVMTRAMPAFSRLQAGLWSREFEMNAAIPKTRFNHKITAHRVVEGRNFDLAEVRAIKSAVEDVTVNDVIVSVCGGALRKYLESKNESPAESMVAMAPISVRPEEGRKSMGNQVAAMTIKIGTDVADPVERIKAVHENAAAQKAMTNAVGAKLMTDFQQFIPSTTAAMAARLYTQLGLSESMSPPFNCVISNVPGPQFPLFSAGAKLVTQFGLGPLYDGMGIFFPVFSYNGHITVSVNACREMMPDPEFFGQCFQDSYDEIKDATVGETA